MILHLVARRVLAVALLVCVTGVCYAVDPPLDPYAQAIVDLGTRTNNAVLLVCDVALAIYAVALGWSLAMKWIGRAARQG